MEPNHIVKQHTSLVGGLEHFPYFGNNSPNWLLYFSEGWLNHQPDQQNQKSTSPMMPWNTTEAAQKALETYVCVHQLKKESESWLAQGKKILKL
jgi:hypothetical protein